MRLIIFFIILLIGSILGVRAIVPTDYVTVAIRNEGTEAMPSAIVHVKGNSYSIGDIKAGATKSVKVCAKGESNIVIEHNNNKQFTIDTYLEAGYKGKITIHLTPTGVLAVNDNIVYTAFSSCSR